MILCFLLHLIDPAGTLKLGLSGRGHALVLEADGTEIDEDSLLDQFQSQAFMILREGECWESKLGCVPRV